MSIFEKIAKASLIDGQIILSDFATTNGASLMISDWVEADGLCHAAVVFMMQQPTDGREYLDPITVVERGTYQMGTYNHDSVRVAYDYEVGLRTI